MDRRVAAVVVGAMFLGGRQASVGGEHMFEIRLSATTPGPWIEAVLVNSSGTAQTILRSANLQPSQLILTDSAGREVKPFDERTRRKYDRSVTKAMFVTIPAGESMPLGKAEFRRLVNGNFDLRWGPFHFRGLPAGAWKARVRFESLIDSFTEHGHSVAMPGVWKGTVESEELGIELQGTEVSTTE